ncbi:carboxypeptidase regulatory-like domain-containing protein [Archangium violaceum]|uniref:carboxypeptidase-like regulatory domain-containing protein n=1 Tax=Archangium violaceum TaxID=83451 RepID=UPI001951F278|nr:carboxypeptidase-like regulatory domain-containing protein [Archangium violaceum]QRN99314.1 carboxypeptidase regulatory-like domain-containing protein [Archangium violaceum]
MVRNLAGGIGVALAVGLLTFFLMRPDPVPPPAPTRAAAPAQRATTPVARASAESVPIPLVVAPDAPGRLRLEGVVLGGDELPVAGAVVTIDSQPPRSLSTEKNGTFVFEGLAPRTYRVEARQGASVALPATVRLNEGTEPLTLRLRFAATVEVAVVERWTGREVEGASVELRGQETLTGSTGGGGRARFEGVLPGRYVVKASTPAHAPALQPLIVGDSPLSSQQVRVELATGSAVSGEVVDARGRPLEGVPVMAERVTDVVSLGDARRDAVHTDARGRWRVPMLEPGMYRFVAGSDSQAPGVSEPVSVDGQREREGVVISLPEPARLAGRVVGRDGSPVAHALVRVAISQGPLGVSLARQVQCDASGGFVFEGLPRKMVDVVALHESATSATHKVDLGERSERTEVVLALDADLSIEGEVFSSETGAPVPEAVVLAEPMSGAARSRVERTLRGSLSVITDASGRFELRGLRPGSYQLKAAPPGTSLERRTSWLRPATRLEAGARGVKLRLVADGKVKGRVQREDGSIPQFFSVSVGGGVAGAVGNGGTGEFIIPDVPAGTHVLRVSGPDFVSRTLEAVQVSPGQEKDVGTLTVDGGRRVSGRVLLPDGAPAAGATVSVSRDMQGRGVVAGPAAAAMSDLRQVTTREDGSFVLEGIGIVPLGLAAEHPQYGRSAQILIPSGVEEVRRDLLLEPTGTLTGRVVQRGQPVSGALVLASIKGAPSGGSGVTTGTDGTFHFGTLTPGTYSVVAMLDGSAGQQMKQATVEVRATEAARLDIDIPQGDITLEVAAQPQANARYREARLFLEPFQQGAPAGQGAVKTEQLSVETPARFTQLVPGSYKLCVVPPGVAPDAGTGAPAPKPRCSFIAVSEAPAVQQMALSLDMP